MKKVLVLQHIDCETPGRISDLLIKNHFSIHVIKSYEEEAIPQTLDGVDGLIVMGGPMGVYEQDRYPFLSAEIRLIEKTLAEKKPILGICLGSQLLATALGAKVGPGKQKEIGWFPVYLKKEAQSDSLLKHLPSSFTALHWHGDIYPLPKGAVQLASSDLTEVQAYRYGSNAYGFLFHMEITDVMIHQWIANFESEIQKEGIHADVIQKGIPQYLPSLSQISDRVFGRWIDLLQS